MRRSWCAVLLVVAVMTGFVSATAEAASPSSGKLTKTKRSLTWKGAEFTTPSPWGQVTCLTQDDPGCDYFTLKLVLGDRAKIELKITGTNPCGADCTAPVTGNDFDVYLYDPNGDVVDDGTTERGVEKVTFTHRKKFNNKPYLIEVNAWMVQPGATYKGAVKVLKVGT